MEMRRCSLGLHMFDADKYSDCPYCSSAAFNFNGDNKSGGEQAMGDNPTRKLDRGAGGNKAGSGNKASTKVMPKSGQASESTSSIGGGRAPSTAKPGSNVNPTPSQQPSAGPHTQVIRTKAGVRPVTGWLVIIAGPGTGASLPIYNGMNSIGRAKKVGDTGQVQEICLDFGSDTDLEISRDAQAKLTYDKKGNEFYLQHGGGNNLTYINDAPVLEVKTLAAYDEISMGNTKMVFVPLCGEKFQWPDDE